MSILIASPCYGRMVTEPYLASLLLLKKELEAAGMRHDVLTIGNESLITRGRDVIAASFLNETDFECMLFIDSDIEFQPADVALLWNLCVGGADVSVGAYRHKNVESRRAAWVGGKLRDVTEFDGPFEVDYAGTGFMLIKRRTFEKLKELHPDWEYEEGFPLEEKPLGGAMRAWAFFQDPIEDSEHGRFHLSEDYFFSKRVREAGMKIMMHPDIFLKHWGPYPY